MSEQPESPGAADESRAADAPAALEPDAPTEAQSASEPAATETASVAPVASTPPPPADPPPAAVSAPTWEASDFASSPSAGGGALEARPEVAVGAAFAGGLVLALILKRLAR